MSKRHVEHRSREPLQECPVVGRRVNESKNVASASLQDVGDVAEVAGHHVARMVWQLPVLVGDGGYLNLRERGRGREGGEMKHT